MAILLTLLGWIGTWDAESHTSACCKKCARRDWKLAQWCNCWRGTIVHHKIDAIFCYSRVDYLINCFISVSNIMWRIRPPNMLHKCIYFFASFFSFCVYRASDARQTVSDKNEREERKIQNKTWHFNEKKTNLSQWKMEDGNVYGEKSGASETFIILFICWLIWYTFRSLLRCPTLNLSLVIPRQSSY